MSSGAVLVRIADDGRIVEWSARAAELLGRSRQEAEGRTVAELTGGGDGTAGGRAFLEALGAVSVRPVLSGASLIWEVRDRQGDGATARDLEILRTLFVHLPIDLNVLDADLRIVRSRNGTGEALPGADAAPVGQSFPESLGLADPEKERAVARRVLTTGEPALRRVVPATPRSGTGRPVYYSLSYVRLEGADGEVLGLVASAIDVTEHERALHRLRLLGKVRTTVGERLKSLLCARSWWTRSFRRSPASPWSKLSSTSSRARSPRWLRWTTTCRCGEPPSRGWCRLTR